MSGNESLNYTGNKAVPCSKRATLIGDCVHELIIAKKSLKKAISNVPDYTGPLDDADYYQDEQQRYYDACAALENAIDDKEV